MHSPAPPPTDPRAEPDVARGYESRDVNLRALLWLAASVVLLMVGSFVGLWALLQSYRGVAARHDPPAFPAGNADQVPPQPRLQNTPMRDYREFRAEEDQQLDSYGWVDQQQGVVRIPISRAMDKALEDGFPPLPNKSDKEDPPAEQTPPAEEEEQR
jgi:hypothetical protein